MAYSVRPATPDDFATLVQFWIETWTLSMPEIDFEARRGYIQGELDCALNDGRIIMVAVEDGGQACGFAIVNLANCELEQIAVALAHLGRGAAALLMQAAKETSPRELLLSVNKGNPRAIWFYAREGFEVIGEGKNAMSGLPILRMRWKGGS
ncbi:MAG: GNAT family N-acetyltransferase [Proteobacteria bacterium]|nr:GNAT family N-acetyltransferase [Pseudomonadota bacterium]